MPEPEPGGELIVEVHATLPDEVRGQPWIDLQVRTSNWVIEQSQGIRRLAAFRLKRLLLHDGQITHQGDPETVLSEETVAQVFGVRSTPPTGYFPRAYEAL